MKYIYNASEEVKSYEGWDIQPSEYYIITEQYAARFATNARLLADLATGLVKMSANGTSPLSGSVSTQIDFLKDITPVDADGAPIARSKAAKAGSFYCLLPVEFATSSVSSVYSNNVDDTARAGITYKIYNSSDEDITSVLGEPFATKTVVDVELPYDYEMIGGALRQTATPIEDVRLWVVAVPDVPAIYGGSKEMIGGINLQYMHGGDVIFADGRAAKYLTYSATTHTNKMRIIIRHPAGYVHRLMVTFEIYR